MDTNEQKRILESLDDERNGVILYQGLAEAEKDVHLAEIYRRMAAVEERHANTWVKALESQGAAVPSFQPSWRTRTLVWLAKRFGVATVLPTVMNQEKAGTNNYQQIASGTDNVAGGGLVASMAADENSHARMLGQITRSTQGGVEGATLAQMEGRHKAAGGNALRAAVLGANDGLVSNLSLVMGVAGAELAGRSILITGIAGLLAGACSMALGEWLSVQSSRELYQHQIEIEKAEIKSAPEEETEELALIYQARGIPEDQARQLATRIMSNPETAIDTLAREELRVDPEELGGSAWEAALTSFFLFAAGAIIPVLPFTFLTGMTAVIVSILFSTVGLFVIGAGITLFTGRPVLFSGSRQVIFGLAAAAITYATGKLIGANLGG